MIIFGKSRGMLPQSKKDDITSEEHQVCPGRLYIAVQTVKEGMKDEITTEEREVCLDSIEQVFIKQDHGNTSFLSEPDSECSRKVLLYSATEESTSHRICHKICIIIITD